MGNDLNSGANNRKNIMPDRSFVAPQIKVEDFQKTQTSQIGEAKTQRHDNYSMSHSIYGFKLEFKALEPKEKKAFENLSANDRSGPGNLPGKSSVQYDLSDVDLEDYDDDNSFTV